MGVCPKGFCPKGFCPRGFRPRGVLSLMFLFYTHNHFGGLSDLNGFDNIGQVASENNNVYRQYTNAEKRLSWYGHVTRRKRVDTHNKVHRVGIYNGDSNKIYI